MATKYIIEDSIKPSDSDEPLMAEYLYYDGGKWQTGTIHFETDELKDYKEVEKQGRVCLVKRS